MGKAESDDDGPVTGAPCGAGEGVLEDDDDLENEVEDVPAPEGPVCPRCPVGPTPSSGATAAAAREAGAFVEGAAVTRTGAVGAGAAAGRDRPPTEAPPSTVRSSSIATGPTSRRSGEGWDRGAAADFSSSLPGPPRLGALPCP
jgi:hypothetical protein